MAGGHVLRYLGAASNSRVTLEAFATFNPGIGGVVTASVGGGVTTGAGVGTGATVGVEEFSGTQPGGGQILVASKSAPTRDVIFTVKGNL